jgi:hypothetical protein
MCLLDSLEHFSAVFGEVLSCCSRHYLLLSHLLALDAVSQVQATKRGDSNAFVEEAPMKVLDSFFHCVASPQLESFRTKKEVNVLLCQDTLSHLRSDSLRRQQCFPAYVLHFVHR